MLGPGIFDTLSPNSMISVFTRIKLIPQKWSLRESGVNRRITGTHVDFLNVWTGVNFSQIVLIDPISVTVLFTNAIKTVLTHLSAVHRTVWNILCTFSIKTYHVSIYISSTFFLCEHTYCNIESFVQ